MTSCPQKKIGKNRGRLKKHSQAFIQIYRKNLIEGSPKRKMHRKWKNEIASQKVEHKPEKPNSCGKNIFVA